MKNYVSSGISHSVQVLWDVFGSSGAYIRETLGLEKNYNLIIDAGGKKIKPFLKALNWGIKESADSSEYLKYPYDYVWQTSKMMHL